MSVLPTPSDILIVDDTRVDLSLLSHMLCEHGFKVRAVLSGPQALTAAQAALPDLILLDILMPDMDGYQVCALLKADARTRDIPVLFISSLNETHDKIKAFTVGGVDYITKPFQADEVLARVRTHLTLRELNRQLQETNAQLAQQVVELEARNQDLDAFAHTVAHDIKSSVGLILGYSELLLQQDDSLPVDERNYSLKMLVKTSVKITKVLNELLLLSEVRKAEVEVNPLDMGSIVAEAEERISPMIENYNAEIVLPAGWPSAIGHAPWIEEVWVNYLSNGCKYGGRPPRLELGGEQLQDGRACFWVKDNGNGVAPDDLARLFTPFTRLDQTRAKGYGLGLSIVRRIVEKLDGQVGVASEGAPGQGSVFSFTLPGVPSSQPI